MRRENSDGFQSMFIVQDGARLVHCSVHHVHVVYMVVYK